MSNMKYPIGIQSFDKIIMDGYLYFDKTALIYDLAHNGNVYFLSRPRRFGKSLLVSTLECYFKGRKELFIGLDIDKLETEWKEYPILHLDFNAANFRDANALEAKLENFVANAEIIYGHDKTATTLGDRFRSVLANAHKTTGQQVVVLIDEYDKPLLDVIGLPDTIDCNGIKVSLEDHHREILKSFYSTFKAADEDLRFVLLTGVTKFSQISVFSGFNQPLDISMDERYDAICGITKEELFEKLEVQIAELAKKLGVTTEGMKTILTKRYDGYHFSARMTDIFNPFSILNVFAKKEIENYWFSTGSPTYLVRLLADYNQNINELVGKYYSRDEFVDYRADVERPLPMIYQSGYLTIKGYKQRTRAYLLDFPNDEVREGFISLLMAGYFKTTLSPRGWVDSVLDAFDDGDVDELERQFTSLFAKIPYSLRDKGTDIEKERHFQYTFFLIMNLISNYTTYAEKQQSEGRIDCIVETLSHVYIFEFKRDSSAQKAIEQIEEKGYAREYAADKRAIHKIGVNFSSQTGTIDGWIAK